MACASLCLRIRAGFHHAIMGLWLVLQPEIQLIRGLCLCAGLLTPSGGRVTTIHALLSKKGWMSRMRMSHKGGALSAAAAIAVLLAVAGACIFANWFGMLPNGASFNLNASLSGVGSQPTNPPQYGPQAGTVNAILTSPDNVRLQIVTVQRSPTRWLFHIHAHNNSIQRVTVWGSADHYFMLSGMVPAGTPVTASQMFLKLSSLSQADLASHAALPSAVNGKADIDGWLAADLSHFPYPPDGFLYYVYGTVTTPACADLQDKSTCHPSTGYRTLVWRL
jgi:hypothetical protein